MLVLFALLLPVICAMLGLMIDTGYAYGQKRLTQSVADNGALAGSTILGNYLINASPLPTGATITAAICDVATQSTGGYSLASFCGGTPFANGLPALTANYVDLNSAVLGSVGGGSIPAGAQGVQVLASQPSIPFFGAAFGLNPFPVTSLATSMVGFVQGMDRSKFIHAVVWFTRSPSPDCTQHTFLAPACGTTGSLVTFLDPQYCTNVPPAAEVAGCKLQGVGSFKGELNIPPNGSVANPSWVSECSGFDCHISAPSHQISIFPLIDGTNTIQGAQGMADVVGWVAVMVDASGKSGTVVNYSVRNGNIGSTAPPVGAPYIIGSKMTQ